MENGGMNIVDEASKELKTIRFKPVKFFSLSFIVFLIFVVAGFVGGLSAVIVEDNFSKLPYLFLLIIGVLAVAFLLRYFYRPKMAPEVVFGKEEILLCRLSGKNSIKPVPYSSLKSIDVRGPKGRQLLVLGTLKRTYLFPLKSIVDSREEVEDKIRSAILNSEDGENRWAAIHDSQKNANLLMGYKTPVVISLLSVIAIIFIVSRILGFGNNVLDLVTLGGNAPVLVDQGQWDRLITSNFLHLSFLHIYFNVISLFIFGTILEKIMGGKKFLVVFFLSSIGGAIASYLAARSLVSVGASGGIFGLMGGLFFINLRMGFRLPGGFNLGKQAWVFLLGFNAGLPFLIPMIDWLAHLGGFLAGVFVTWLLLRKNMSKAESTEVQLRLWRADSLGISIACAVLVGIVLLSFAIRGSNFDDRSKDADVLAATLLNKSDISVSTRNLIAWAMVTDRNRSDESLSFAKTLMRPIVDELELSGRSIDDLELSQYVDTYASILFLQGEYVDALEYQYRAIDLKFDQYYASQISRFLAALNAQQGVWVRGSVAESVLRLRGSENDIELIRDVNSVPVRVTIHVRKSGVRRGYFECDFVDNIGELTLTSKSTLFGVNRAGLDFEIAAIDTHRVSDSKQGACKEYEVDGVDSIETAGILQSLL